MFLRAEASLCLGAPSSLLGPLPPLLGNLLAQLADLGRSRLELILLQPACVGGAGREGCVAGGDNIRASLRPVKKTLMVLGTWYGVGRLHAPWLVYDYDTTCDRHSDNTLPRRLGATVHGVAWRSRPHALHAKRPTTTRTLSPGWQRRHCCAQPFFHASINTPLVDPCKGVAWLGTHDTYCCCILAIQRDRPSSRRKRRGRAGNREILGPACCASRTTCFNGMVASGSLGTNAGGVHWGSTSTHQK